MTVLEVSWQIYYDTAAKISDGAAAFWNAIDGEYPALMQATEMTGTYSEAKEWAASYDERATKLLELVTQTADATHNYALIMQTLGHNHATAEHTATYGTTAPPPEAPTPIASPVLACHVPLPSAGGPGYGLVDYGLGLCDKIGVPVPDGNATTLSNASETWARIAAAPGVVDFLAVLEAAAAAFDDVIAPEAAFIDEDLRTVRAAVTDFIAGAQELATSCQSHREALDELRTELRGHLETIAEALLWELGTTAAIGFVGSFFTFGGAAVAGSAAAVAIAARYARPIRAMIEAWKTRRAIAAGVKMDADIARHVAELERIEGMRPSGVPSRPAVPRKPDLSTDDVAAINDYARDGSNLNEALWNGTVTPAQADRIADVNAALDKLPPYEGPVTRQITLTRDQLDRYEIGKNVIEPAFTSASPPGKNIFSGNVEFQILSKNGKEIVDQVEGHYKREHEVLFKQPTEFHVVNKIPGPDGRTIIQMMEI